MQRFYNGVYYTCVNIVLFLRSLLEGVVAACACKDVTHVSSVWTLPANIVTVNMSSVEM